MDRLVGTWCAAQPFPHLKIKAVELESERLQQEAMFAQDGLVI
jgi:hypothetical protein